jgi:hypothetical protein
METSTTEGAGDFLLAGAPGARFRSWREAFADSESVYYAISQDGGGFEVGAGTLVYGTPDRIQRDEVYSSSNGGAAVEWGAGKKVIYSTVPAVVAEEWVREVAVLKVHDDPSTATTNDGDRYLINGGFGDWVGHDNEFATWDAGEADWVFEVPGVGDQCRETTGILRTYKWSGSLWVFVGQQEFGAPISPNFPLYWQLGSRARVDNIEWSVVSDGYISIADAHFDIPSPVAGRAHIYVDPADGDLKVAFGDGTVKTIVVDT